MIKCEICGKELVSIKALSQHIKNHDITSKDYYLKYIGEQKKCEECGKVFIAEADYSVLYISRKKKNENEK